MKQNFPNYIDALTKVLFWGFSSSKAEQREPWVASKFQRENIITPIPFTKQEKKWGGGEYEQS